MNFFEQELRKLFEKNGIRKSFHQAGKAIEGICAAYRRL